MLEIVNIKERKEDIISLWQEAFGDSRDYIEFFLNECPDIVCLGNTCEGRLASMFFLLNGIIGEYRCKYLYAACTAIRFREKGLMGDLLEYAKKYCTEEGFDFIFLVPCEEALYSYYSKFGFEPRMRKAIYTVSGGNGGQSFQRVDDVSRIAEKRMTLLGETDSFCFDRKTTEYAVREFLNGGGEVYIEDGCFLFFVVRNGKKCVVKELIAEKDCNLTLNLHLFKNLGEENIYIHTPIVYNGEDNGCVCTKCGMLCPLTEEARAFAEAHGTLYAGMYLD